MHVFKRLIFVLTVCALTASAVAQDTPPPRDDAKNDPAAVIAPFLTDTTFLVVRVDLSRIKLPPLVDKLETLGRPLLTNAGEREKRDFDTMLTQLRGGAALAQGWIDTYVAAGGRDAYLLVTLDSLDEPPVLLVLPLPDGEAPPILTTIVQMAKAADEWLETRTMHGAMVIGRQPMMAMYRPGAAERKDELARAFGAVDGFAAQAALVPPAYVRRAINEMVPELPDEVGGGPISTLTDGLLWAAAGVDVAPDIRASVIAQSKDNDAAQAFAELLNKSLGLLAREEKAVTEKLVEQLRPTVANDRLTWKKNEKDIDRFVAQLAPIVHQERTRARRAVAISNLHIIDAALRRYEAEHKRLPPDLPTLLEANMLHVTNFFSGHAAPPIPQFRDWPAEKRSAWLKENATVVYLPREQRLAGDAANRVLLYDRTPIDGEHAALLSNGAVQWLTEAQLKARLNEQADAKR